MILQVDGPACKCGQRGCLEALASGTAIARMAGERLARGEQSILTGMVDSSVKSVTSALVSVAARKGDTLACGVIDAAAGYLGIGLANLVNIFNPQMIIIGGGVSRMGEMLLKPTRKAMKAHAFKLPGRTVRVVRPGLGLDAGLMGAAVYARQKWEVTG
jgi:glucokinase